MRDEDVVSSEYWDDASEDTEAKEAVAEEASEEVYNTFR